LFDHLGGELGAMHGEVHAGGEDGIEERIRIPDHDPAPAADAAAGIGVVAGGVEVAVDLGPLHSLVDVRYRVEGA
jgi:hypothetical protein